MNLKRSLHVNCTNQLLHQKLWQIHAAPCAQWPAQHIGFSFINSSVWRAHNCYTKSIRQSTDANAKHKSYRQCTGDPEPTLVFHQNRLRPPVIYQIVMSKSLMRSNNRPRHENSLSKAITQGAAPNIPRPTPSPTRRTHIYTSSAPPRVRRKIPPARNSSGRARQ